MPYPAAQLVDDGAVVAYHVPPIDRFPRQYLGRVLLVTRGDTWTGSAT